MCSPPLQACSRRWVEGDIVGRWVEGADVSRESGSSEFVLECLDIVLQVYELWKDRARTGFDSR